MKKFLIDTEKCTGCMLCSIACKDEHVGHAYAPWSEPQPDTGHFWMNIRPLERGTLPRVRMTYLPVHCQHCESAPCIPACPETAIKSRDDGLVWIDPAACTGCKDCLAACPYDVIYMNDELDIAQKCTGCAHRVDAGEAPRCVQVCPHDVILFDEIKDVSGLETYLPESGAAPRVYWKGLPKPWIAGVVVDPELGEVITGASVTITDRSRGGSDTAATDEFGDFYITGLAEGQDYRVLVQASGYEDFVADVTTNGDQDLGTVLLARRA